MAETEQLREGTRRRRQSKPPLRANRAKLMVSIVNRHDEERLNRLLEDHSVTVSFSFAGMGTARSAVLDYLGIGETEKSVVLSLFPEHDEALLLRELRAQMALYLVGRGISFTVPLTGVSELIASGLTGSHQTMEGKIMTDRERKYDLIMAIVAENSVDDAMEAARGAGAAGGTRISARSLENAKAEQFIGISLTEEQEILLILSKRESKLAIMQALSERVGLKTEAGGVILSLPVDRTAGIGPDEEREEAESRG